jgi:hypothetical protein
LHQGFQSSCVQLANKIIVGEYNDHNEKNRTNSILHPPHMIIMKLSCC